MTTGARWWCALALAIGMLAGPAAAREPAALPLKPARTLDYRVTHGTFVSLDVSPDGGTIVFDLLGELYTMPIAGGRARAIATGMAFDTQPTFSPDGRSIAFVSDRSGGDNVWVARADGGNPRRVTSGDAGLIRSSPAWSADGKSIFVSRYRIELDGYELWRHPIDGGPPALMSPVKATPGAPRETWRSALGASASRDGRWLYFARQVGGLSFAEPVAWTIVRRDLATGVEQTVVEGAGGRNAEAETFFRPVVSPDGALLAYATRRMGRTFLRLRDLRSGDDRPLGEAALDQSNASAWQDLAPRYAFTPDGRAILIVHDGVLERRPVDGTAAQAIPFDARLRLAVGPSTRVRIREDTGPVRARLAQGTTMSPDGKRVAFAALGGLYVQAVGARAAARLPATPDMPAQPAWRADGVALAFVTWSEAAGGAVWTMPSDGSAPPRRIGTTPAFYTNPVFVPGRAEIVAIRSPAAQRRQRIFEFGDLRAAELVVLSLADGSTRVVARGRFGGRPHFVTGRADAVHLLSERGLVAVALADGAMRQVATVEAAGYYFVEGTVPVDDLRLSPDGRWLAAQTSEQLYVAPLPTGGGVVDLTDPRSGGRRVSASGADFFAWGADGGLVWSVGAEVHRLASPSAARASAVAQLVAELPRAISRGSLLLRGARALTMASGDRIIDDADILITGDRIAAVGPRGTLPVPAGTPVRELGGRTVSPGLIDAHDHIGSIRRGVLASEDWGLRLRLAFGVTTSFDPSTLGIDQLAYQDLLDAGLMIGPRLRSTGPALFSKERFASLDQVRATLGRYRHAWGLRNVKQYRGETRTIRQWIAIAARELGLQPTIEGNNSAKLMLTQAIDGYAGNEHIMPVAPLQDDVVQLLVRMRTSSVLTLLNSSSGGDAGDSFVALNDPAGDPRVRRFMPPGAIERKLARRRSWTSAQASRVAMFAGDAARLAAAGALVGIGSHGDDPGSGFHDELQAHAAGMTPLAILHAATAGSAETIGRLDDLGTLEAGKLADLVVFDRDPLADIRNTRSVALVMRGGQLFDAPTLDALWPVARPLPPPWFAAPDVDHWLP